MPSMLVAASLVFGCLRVFFQSGTVTPSAVVGSFRYYWGNARADPYSPLHEHHGLTGVRGRGNAPRPVSKSALPRFDTRCLVDSSDDPWDMNAQYWNIVKCFKAPYDHMFGLQMGLSTCMTAGNGQLRALLAAGLGEGPRPRVAHGRTRTHRSSHAVQSNRVCMGSTLLSHPAAMARSARRHSKPDSSPMLAPPGNGNPFCFVVYPFPCLPQEAVP